MSSENDEQRQRLMDFDREEEGFTPNNSSHVNGTEPLATGSQYALTRSEAAQSLANRMIHSRAYIIFYISMVALSTTTVALSLTDDDGCPDTAFFVLEFLVNSAMIAEVVVRGFAFGKAFWKSVFNWIDLAITLFCVVTLIVLVSTPCESKGEEVFDTVLLIIRNLVQFGRLAIVMRRSGQSIFSRPRPIDLSRASGPRPLDIDIDEEDFDISHSSNAMYSQLPADLEGDQGGERDVIFDADNAQSGGPDADGSRHSGAVDGKSGARAVNAPPPEEEDAWANVG